MAIRRVTAVEESATTPAVGSLATPAFVATAGNLIVVSIRHNTGLGVTIAITDTAGNTYTQIKEANLGGVDRIRLYYAYNCLGNAANVVTCTFTGGTVEFVSLLAAQYSGIRSATDPLDASASGNGTGTTATSGSFTTTQANELCIASASWAATGSTFTPGDSYSTVISDADGMMTLAEKTVSVIQPGVTASISVGVSNPWEIVTATFKANTNLEIVSSTGGTIGTAASTWSMAVPASTGLEGGGAIIVGIGVASSAAVVSTVTDNTTNVYVRAIALGTPRPVAGAEIWYTAGCSSASTRVSVTLDASSSGSMGLMHITGINPANALDVTGSSAITTNSTTHGSGGVTSAKSSAVGISFARMTASTIGTITILDAQTAWLSTGATGADRTLGLYKILASPSTISGAFTTSSGCQHASAIAVFSGFDAFGGGRPRRRMMLGVG